LQHLEPETETTMTDERMALLELIEKQADSDFVRDMLAFAADRIMEMEVEVEARTGAAKGTRSPLREVQRNVAQGDLVPESIEKTSGVQNAEAMMRTR
jgi:hypothetical protein